MRRLPIQIAIFAVLAQSLPALSQPQPEWDRITPIPRARLSWRYKQADALEANSFPNHKLDIEVRVEAEIGYRVSLERCVQSKPEPAVGRSADIEAQQPQLIGEPAPGTSSGASVVISTYSCALDIKETAQPLPYEMKLVFRVPRPQAPGTTEEQYSSFEVPVGVKGTTNRPTPMEIRPPRDPIRITAGKPARFNLTVKNNFAQYAITVKGIALEDDADGLVSIDTSHAWSDVGIDIGEEKAVPVYLRGTGMSLSRLIEGWGPNPTIKLKLRYHDGYRSSMETAPPQTVSFKPTFDPLAILFAAFIGGLVGVLIRLYGIESGRESRRKRLHFIARMLVSVVLSGLVVLIAQFTKIELVANDDRLRFPFSNPIAAFIVGLIIALYDPKVIIAWLRRLFKPGAEAAGDDAEPAPAGGTGKKP